MPLHRLLAIFILCAVPVAFGAMALAHPNHSHDPLIAANATTLLSHQAHPPALPRSTILMISLTVFVLAVFIGFEVIAKVPPTLHTPLMSGSNAISGITVVGAIITTGYSQLNFGTWLGFVAIVLANINVVGGFLVTHRMLLMFKKR